MQYPDVDLRRLVARATPLDERLAGAVVPVAGLEDLIAQRIARWREAASPNENPRDLERRLALDGLDLERCRPFLGEVKLAEEGPLPEWASRFERLLEWCLPERARAELPDYVTPPPPEPDKPMPFDEPDVTRRELPFPD
ncbi:MAG: hypothetical protein AB7K24_32045, partial [Gemmataceae bacterium]